MEKLSNKIKSLPMQPGVYIMKDKKGKVIYVGKAKYLRNRVSSYFTQNKSHSFKTHVLVSNIYDFDIIVTKSEFDALVLENSLIKKHKPKYNILLKDDKGYPFIKITYKNAYPDMYIVSKPQKDGNKYLGPYSSRSVCKNAIDTIKKTLKIRDCSKVFPRDIGKERACLNAHIGRCDAPCTNNITKEQYLESIKQAEQLLKGNFSNLLEELTLNMEKSAENLDFELAAVFRDKINAINKLKDKQTIVTNSDKTVDVFAYTKGYTKSAITILHYMSGTLVEKEFTIIDVNFNESEALSSYISQYYSIKECVPNEILVSCNINDIETLESFLSTLGNTKIINPIKGLKKEFINLAILNGQEEITRIETLKEKTNKTLTLLAEIIGYSGKINRIESYDISNIAGKHTVGSMVVFENGRPLKRAYRKFKINSVIDTQDDYSSMKEMIIRRFENANNEKFLPLPELILLDGGFSHVNTIAPIIEQYNNDILVLGMVKDNRHKTRGLIYRDGREVSLDTIPHLFAFIGAIQEETHRFAITYNKNLRKKSLVKSSLDEIVGVGENRKNILLKHFKTVSNIKKASVTELSLLVPLNIAENIYKFYNEKE